MFVPKSHQAHWSLIGSLVAVSPRPPTCVPALDCRVSALPPRARVIAVAAANKHSAAVTAGGEVFTWGGNSSGQLGYGTPDSAFNATPRLVDSLKGKTLVSVSAAKRHTGAFGGSKSILGLCWVY